MVTSADIGLADHPPVFVVRKYARENLNRQFSRIKYRDMKSFDEDQFKRTLEQIPWETAFVFEDIDDVVYMLGRRCLILPSMFISDLQIAVRVQLRVRVFHAVWRAKIFEVRVLRT